MKVIAIVNRKGGVGKTATAHALGAGLINRGYSVLYVDLDSQMNLTDALKASNNKLSSMDVLTGRATAEEAIQGGILAASEELALADTTLTETGREYRLKEALEGLKYDYCVIDTPAALNILTMNALTAAECAIVPAGADFYSMQGLTQLYDSFLAVKKYCNHDLTIKGILLTRYSKRAIISRDMKKSLEKMAESMDTKVFETEIRECVAIKEAQAMQTDIFTYAKRSNAAKDYNSFIDEFLK